MASQVTAHDIIGHLCDLLLIATDRGQWCTLPALARTCRAFFEPAIAAIWRDLPSLEILIHLLPQDAWEIVADETRLGYTIDDLVVRAHLLLSSSQPLVSWLSVCDLSQYPSTELA